mmetsp:Transcript_11922/g.19759  ORF Transcript_11922/g.19759 Transcript_11922/m.19759 type:complete len:281 (-) Transcript_11922:93-935(-)|eukprot:CAMPEP_0119006274 /NCGR_PEP_ID=MMETSP1176-20130426/2206_1 /TAXON_ID=265551 /ORGANISM="Synedropsis recta cf, Strain CCMP1620" /LENGTH=280 /DNA_ID=CAMNT_0006958173 /DNA_START=68 /DNA_END=910 /DNA_ORIENTATION=+
MKPLPVSPASRSFMLLALLSFAAPTRAFAPTGFGVATTTNVVRLQASTTESLQERRKTLLSRKGPFFELDPKEGAVEFGATANLVTQLENDENDGGPSYIKEWLSDEQRVATSIWDEDLIVIKGDSVYQLQVMKLKFVTLQLQPSVDIKMWTKKSAAIKGGDPVFYLQSVGFEPNIQVLPGLTIDAKALGIDIEVVGQLAATKDGKGVSGKISFSTSGKLPGPLRILPEGALRAASDSINETITQFAISSFQKGAIKKYQEFRATKIAEQQKEQEEQQSL